MRVRLEDLAREACVSLAAVSRTYARSKGCRDAILCRNDDMAIGRGDLGVPCWCGGHSDSGGDVGRPAGSPAIVESEIENGKKPRRTRTARKEQKSKLRFQILRQEPTEH